jgi:hypothetical protein
MNPPAPTHTKYIVGAIVLVVLACIGCGTYLLATGYQSGELLIGIAGAGTGALGGMVATRSQTHPGTPVEVKAPEGKPLETVEVKPTETKP